MRGRALAAITFFGRRSVLHSTPPNRTRAYATAASAARISTTMGDPEGVERYKSMMKTLETKVSERDFAVEVMKDKVSALEEQLRDMARAQKYIGNEEIDVDDDELSKKQEEIGRLEKEVHILQAAVSTTLPRVHSGCHLPGWCLTVCW
eukprot:2719187-Pyramimonas_sp.AAC.1